MSKSLQYVKIFETLQAANGPVTVSAIKAIPGIVPTRLSTYLWEIKKNTGFTVTANRDGRTVVSYELAGTGTAPAPKVAKVKPQKQVATVTKPAKEKPAKKAKQVSVPVMEQDSLEQAMMNMVKTGLVDVLDEIDTNVVDLEDREYASGFVRGVL